MIAEEKLKDYIKEESLKNHFVKVFDENTILAVHKLAKRGFFKELEFLISEGKEAVVFRAVTNSGTFVAVKVYKIETSGFRRMQDYLEGDLRFKKVGSDKRSIVFAWTKKEYKNLEIAVKANLNVPFPIAFYENCLVMEFIGKKGKEKGEYSQRLKENPPKDPEKAYQELIKFIAGLYEQGLVHADLSEYNILNNEETMVVIDLGQAVTKSHSKAEEFFNRDIKNLSKYFAKLGVNKSEKQIKEEVKKELKK